MYLARCALSVAVAAELLRRHPFILVAGKKRLALFIQSPLELLSGAIQCQPVQLAGRVLLQLMAQLRQLAPLPALLLTPCSFLLLLILCHGGVFLSRAHARTTIYNTQG